MTDRIERGRGGDDLQAAGSGRREVSETKWLLAGPVGEVRAGARFVNGELVERSQEKDAA